MNSKVFKGNSPEEQALIGNIESLLSELKGMGTAGTPGGAPAGAPGAGLPQAGTPAGAPAPQFNPDEADDDVNKEESAPAEGFQEQDDGLGGQNKPVAKDIQSTEHDGYDANGGAEDSIFEDLPEYDKEDIDELSRSGLASLVKKQQKMISQLVASGRGSVKKSQGAGNQVNKSIETLARQVARQGQILAEVLEGIGATQGVGQIESAPRGVAKSGRAPVAGYPGDNANIIDMIADAVVQKSQGRIGGGIQSTGDAELDALLGEGTHSQPEVVRKSTRSFVEGMASMSQGLWGK